MLVLCWCKYIDLCTKKVQMLFEAIKNIYGLSQIMGNVPMDEIFSILVMFRDYF